MQRLAVFAVLALGACSGPSDADTPAPAKHIAVVPPKPAKPPRPQVPSKRLPDAIDPLAYDLRLEVDPDTDAFTGAVTIHARINAATDRVWLHADDLDITSATFDGTPLVRVQNAGDRMVAFSFGKQLAPGTITLAFAFAGHTAHDQEGLFRQKAGGRWYLFSQGESEFARRFVPCFDEPRWKTPWRVTLVVPKGDVGVANMPLAHEATLSDGRRELAFAESPPMPSYLVAVAAGPFAIVDAGVVGKARVPVRVVVPAPWRDKVAVVAAQLPAIVAALETYTADGLPLAKLDFAAVPRFFGAMENPGLITFESDELVGDPKRVAGEFVRIAAHELAHQWFGDLVTPAWWDDLWLSEAFASWLGDRVATQLGFYERRDLRRAITRAHALEADDAADAQPLHRHTTFDPENEFDAIAYDKGQAVLETFEAWIGDDGFRDALRGYLAAHRGGSVHTSDLVLALATTKAPGAGAALAAYVDHAGPPIVELELSCTPLDGSGRAPGAALVGHARDGLSIPVCVRYADSKGAVAHACGVFGDHNQLALPAADPGCPAWLVPDDVGYYEVVWKSNGPPGPAPPWAKLSPAEKLVMVGDLAAAASRGDLAIRDALAELVALSRSGDLYGEYGAVLIARALDAYVDDATRPAWQAWLAKQFAARITPETAFKPPRGYGIEHRAAVLALVTADHLPVATVRRARAVLDAAVARGEPVDPLVVLAAGDDRAAFDKLAALAADKKSDARDDAADDLGWFGAAEAEPAAALAATLAHPWAALEPYFERGATRTAAWAALKAHLAEILATASARAAGDVVDTMATLCDATLRAEVATAFAPHVAKIIDGKPRLERALASIDRCVARRAKVTDFAAALQ
jgi:alanyl aminopeptidase